MNIVAFCYCFAKPGYANSDVLNLIEELRKEHQIHFFSFSKGKDKKNLRYYEIIPVKKVMAMALDEKDINTSRFYNYFFLINVVFKILMFIKKIKMLKPDFIISDSAYFIMAPVYILSRILKVPLVVYCRETYLGSSSRNPLKNLFRLHLKFLRNFIMKGSELIVAMDGGLKEYFQRQIGKQVYLVPASINFEFELRNIREKLNLPANDKLILYTGHYEKNRGFDLLIESFAEIKTIDSKLVLGGRMSNIDKAYLNDLAKKFNVENSITYIPMLPYSDVPSLIYSCDICVDPFPRSGNLEFQLGLKDLEYMAIGKPVIAIDVKGNRLLIKNGYNGILTYPNAEDFSKKLLLLLKNSDLRNELGENARETIRRNYDSKKVADDFINLIRSRLDIR